MGKKVKQTSGFKNKARRTDIDIIVDHTETNKIQVDLPEIDTSKYDESNPLVLPSAKRKTTIKRKQGAPKKQVLSKTQRKKLEKIVERREKKSCRADLVAELQKYQLSSETYKGLTPLIQVQTEGIKILSQQADPTIFDDSRNSEDQGKTPRPSSKPRWKKNTANCQKYLSWSRRFTTSDLKNDKNPNVLGFSKDEESSDDDDIDESESEKEEAEESEGKVTELATDNEINDNHGDNMVDDSRVIENGNNRSDDGNSEENVEISNIIENDNDDSTVPPKSEQEAKLPTNTCADASLVSANNKNSLKKKKKMSSVQETTTSNPSEMKESNIKKKKFVHVERTQDIIAVRAKLPIIPEEQVIMEQITENLCVVLAGETGCGKTTQVPQFLYEAGYAANGKIIGITEPRRVAAISMASRVAKELSLTSKEVSFQIRFEGTVSPKTLIKFMTDGVLLKEMGNDFLLTKYSVVCIDEAHERSLFTDILIGLLSRCVIARQKRGDPLKLVIMSATMRIEDFMENNQLFKTKPGFIHIPARQFPVQIHFSKVTPSNYIEAAIKKVIQIHKKLPPGGILVFVTGQQEVLQVVKHLRKLCPDTGDGDETKAKDDDTSSPSTGKSFRSLKKKNLLLKSKQRIGNLKSMDLNQAKPFPHEDEDTESDSDDDNSDSGDIAIDDIDASNLDPLHILPLYSMLPIQEQKKVFEAPPPGKRLCVVTTNVAETSLTIPSVRYVVDAGKVKDKLWDKVTGVQTFRISWCSKASAEQRAGRAGRVGPGHCYRIFSSAVFEHEFPEYSTPEIKARPVDDMVLLMKSMAIDNVQNFPYPTHPGVEQLSVAENILTHLGALDNPPQTNKLNKKAKIPPTITPLGLTMAQFPVGPRLAKMLSMSFNHELTEYMVLLASALTVQEVLIEAPAADKEAQNKWASIRRKWAGTGPTFLLGDCMVLIRAVGAFESDGWSAETCYKLGLRYKAMVEIRKLRKQLTNNINMLVSNQKEILLNPKLKPPSEHQSNLMRQIMLSGCPDRIARKVQPEEVGNGDDKQKFKHAYKCGELEDLVYIYSGSVLKKCQPEWVIYQEAFELNDKIYLRGVTAIEPEWILSLCPSMCHPGEPLKDPEPFYDSDSGLVKCYVKATYGRQGWELPITDIEYPSSSQKYRYFAQFLLEGEIFEGFKKWSQDLLSLPKTMTKSWAKLQPRTQILLQKLISAQVESKESLRAQWKKDKEFLLNEYLQWIPERLHKQVSKSWPPLE